MGKSIRPLGDITLDLEPLINEMVNDHELQKGEILALINVYLDIHHPECIEKYVEGGQPVFYYGYKGDKK